MMKDTVGRHGPFSTGRVAHNPYQHQEQWIPHIGIADKSYRYPKDCLHAYIDVHCESAKPFPRRMLKSPPASFSRRSDPQRTREGTPPVIARLACWTAFLSILGYLSASST